MMITADSAGDPPVPSITVAPVIATTFADAAPGGPLLVFCMMLLLADAKPAQRMINRTQTGLTSTANGDYGHRLRALLGLDVLRVRQIVGRICIERRPGEVLRKRD